MNLGVLTTSYPTSDADPSGRFVDEFARALLARGHGVSVVAPEPPHRLGPPCRLAVGAPHVHWRRYLRPRRLQQTFHGAGVPDNLCRTWAAWPGVMTYPASLFAHLRAWSPPPEVLFAHWALPNAWVAGWALPHVPLISVFHSADVHLLSRLVGRGLWAQRIARTSHAMVFVARALQERFLGLLSPSEQRRARERCHVLPMGVPAAPLQGARRQDVRRDLKLDGYVVMCMGRLVSIKGVANVIRAASTLASDRAVRLVIVGEGPERESLQAYAARMGVQATFTGAVGQQAKHRYLRAADVFVLPSRVMPSGRTEGMPVSLLEAMASGLVVVASNVGGIPDVIEHGRNGWLVPPGRPDAIAHALQVLHDSPELARALATQAARTASQYAWPVHIQRFESLAEAAVVAGAT
jgi:glycosyltransferase involved in cell wall biosynthesis